MKPAPLIVQDVEIPRLSFGTSGLSGRGCTKMVRTALDLGFRHIDTAEAYGNEEAIGRALNETDVPRAEIFVTTKVWMANLGRNDLLRSAEGSCRRLGGAPIDLLLPHWPNESIPISETLAALADARERGFARHVGLSNFTPSLFDEALAATPVPLIANQIEYHARMQAAQRPMRERLAAQDMALLAYCALGRGLLVRDRALAAIGAPHGKSAAQVAIRWLLEQDGVVAITKSSSERHAREAVEAAGFEFTESDRTAIAAMDDGRRVLDPSWAPVWE